MARRAILILGMHRSGTSALTRVLNLCGASLPERLLPPNASNETGYWESTAIVSFHDRLLADAGSAWTDPFEFPAAWFHTEEGQVSVERLAALILEEFGDSPLVVIKDPRACRLVPLWLRAFERLSIEPLVVLIVRHPLEVAASLERRDGLPAPAALRLWLQHVLDAESETRTCKRVVVTYEQLLGAWSAAVDRIDRELELRLPERYGGSPTAEAIAAFLAPSLRHETRSREDLAMDAEGVPWVREVYEWHLHAAEHGADDTTPLDRVRAELRRVDAALTPYAREQAHRITIGERRVRELEHHVAALAADLETHRRRLAELEAEREEADRRWQAKQAQWNERERALEAELADATQRACHLHDRMLAMERSPFWRARTWLRRQQARLTGGTGR